MSFLGRIASKRRVRDAVRRLGMDSSAANYFALAREYVVLGNPQDVLRVCTEGLDEHPGDAQLTRLAERSRALLHDDRLRMLTADLAIAPRPGLWREQCELLLEVGKVGKAEDAAEAWWRQTRDGEALYFRARCRAHQFFEDRRAADGRVAFELALEAGKELPSDLRPLKLAFEIARRCGAWNEARTALARMLELRPGNPDLEQRFRAVLACLEGALPLERALQQVERTGEFSGDQPADCSAPDDVVARPLLQQLGAAPEVHGAVYVRGGTALVQGPQGPTADRTARGVRDVVQSSRMAARRLSLGQVIGVELEGSFGNLTVLPGERGTAALWAGRQPSQEELGILAHLAGAAARGAA